MKFSTVIFVLLFAFSSVAQSDFPFTVSLEEVTIDGLPGIHSFSSGQHDGKWLIVGGRLDGLHARQPFNAFPASQNNTNIFVVDPENNLVKSASINSLPVGLKEQLQGTNFQFFQDGERLIITGGYGYSETMSDHITFPDLTVIDLPSLIEDILNDRDITPNFQQITDAYFAVTGGNLGKIGDEFYLVGGHRFDGRYNPMNHATFVQTYTDAIRKFTLNGLDGNLSFVKTGTISDQVHLHRRDYNLLPQIFPDGSFGYTIFSGVFQINQNLPFLYPVNINASGHEPIPSFNQYLSHYHSPKIAFFDRTDNSMHNLFFGGISQYYHGVNGLIQDDNVPFVKTISRVSRNASDEMEEVKLAVEMPELLGTGAEFFPNENLETVEKDIFDLEKISTDSVMIGYIFGGIRSSQLNPFSQNNTGVTSAFSGAFRVRLISDNSTNVTDLSLDGYHGLKFTISPNPVDTDFLNLKVISPEAGNLEILLSDNQGRLLGKVIERTALKGENNFKINLKSNNRGMIFTTVILNGKHTATEKVIVKF